jgi:uncharacterized membrane protein
MQVLAWALRQRRYSLRDQGAQLIKIAGKERFMISNEANYTIPGERHNNIGQDRRYGRENVGVSERWISMIIGGGLLLYGLRQGLLKGMLPSLAGSALIYRGATGHSSLYRMLGIDTSDYKRPGVSVPHGQGVKIERSIVVNKSPEELYHFWRDAENLPRFMSHVATVQTLGSRSRWKMKSVAGTEVEWDAEIVNDKPNELIAWRTLEGAQVDHAGSVHFERLAGDHGTKVKVVMEYRPPAGNIGVAMAKLFGDEPEQILDTDLRRFKQLMETGDMASAEHGPRGLV